MPSSTESRFADDEAATAFLFRSIERVMHDKPLHGLDANLRDLTPTRVLLERLGNPGASIRFMLVTGSKGKGSTAVMAARVLRELGYQTGLMTSPSLVSFRERIRVNGRAIGRDDFTALVERIAPHVEVIDAALPEGNYFSPTGMILALAVLYFEAQGVEVAVIEAGRGGRFDDTRLVRNEVAVLTPIMLEHPEYLGPTLTDIAWNKAGIIKEGSSVVSAGQPPEALPAIEREVAAQGASLRMSGTPALQARPAHSVEHSQAAGLAFEVETAAQTYADLFVPLSGRYQIENAALAIGAVEALLEKMGRQPPDPQRVRAGLGAVVWPGRCQVLSEHPLVIVDGAINEVSARLFCESVVRLLRPPVVALVAVPQTKDYAGVLREMAAVASRVIVTRFDTPYLRFPVDGEVLELAQTLFRVASLIPDFGQAYAHALRQAGENGTLLIAGTQTLVAATLRQHAINLEQI